MVEDDSPERELPGDDVPGDGSEVIQPTTTAAALARRAMEQAREAARARGAGRASPRAAKRNAQDFLADGGAQGKAQTGGSRKKAGEEPGREPFSPGRDPRAFGDAIATLLQREGWDAQLAVGAVTGRWREVVGDQIADHCEPLGFEDGRLTVKASSSAWAAQLTLMQGQLKAKLNDAVGRTLVTELTVLGPTARSWVKGPRTVKGRGPRDTYG